jgi:RNA polymerase sigma-70 factor (ECF subfamily)
MAEQMPVAVQAWSNCGERAFLVADSKTRSFGDLYREQAPFVWRILRRLGVPESDLDDTAHEVFMVAYQKRDRLFGEQYERSWLFGIAKRIAMHGHRKRSKRPEALDGPIVVAENPESQAAKRQAAELARAAIDSLDERRRMVFVLVELEQMTAPEVAATLEIPLNTVYSRLRTARREFEQAVNRRTEERKDARGGS